MKAWNRKSATLVLATKATFAYPSFVALAKEDSVEVATLDAQDVEGRKKWGQSLPAEATVPS